MTKFLYFIKYIFIFLLLQTTYTYSQTLAPKVVIVTAFERGDYQGDAPGEAQLWIERLKLKEKYRMKGLIHPLFCDKNAKICLSITGPGKSNASASIMALGLAAKINLKDSYFIVASIAGIDSKVGTLGSVTIVNEIVDGDLFYQLDRTPKGASFPFRRLGCRKETWCKAPWKTGGEHFKLNRKIVDSAYKRTKSVKLLDGELARSYRKNFKNKAALGSPKVQICATMSADTFWHGQELTQWARFLTDKLTEGRSHFCTANMEDSATALAFKRLEKDGLIDWNKVIYLRSASDFTSPPSDKNLSDGLGVQNGPGGGFEIAIENVYRVGKNLADAILKDNLR